MGIDKNKAAAEAAAELAKRKAAGTYQGKALDNYKPAEKKKAIVTSSSEEAERQKYVASHPNKVVTQKEYDYLMDLYKKAEAADATGTKKTKESEIFQKAYHDILPEEAGRIIATHPVKTKKALAEGRTWWDLEGNVDAYFGPRTKQYMEALEKKKPQAQIQPTPEVAKDKPREPAQDQLIYSHGDPEKERALPPIAPAWWLQDEMAAVNAGLNYAGIKPYYPHEPKVDYQEARPTFLSPERQLAENQSQMRQQLDMLSRFKGPQAFNARANEISGKGFANAANTIADVHNRNVGIANQFEQFNTGIRNQEARENNAHVVSLWDKYTATKQNFDNAKREAGDAMFNVAKQAVTNRANTYNINQINPQWAVNPGQGGTMYFHDPRQLKPGQKQAPIGDAYKQKLADPAFQGLASSDDGRKILWNITQKEYGVPTDDLMETYGKSRNIPNQQVPVPGYPTT